MQTEVLFEEALNLSPLDKVRLMDLLFQSFNRKTQQTEHEQLWANHAETICNQIDQKQMTLHALEDVLQELNQ